MSDLRERALLDGLRLQALLSEEFAGEQHIVTLATMAADRIEALEAEVERLTALVAELEAAQRVHPSLAGVNPVDVIILCGIVEDRMFHKPGQTMAWEPELVRAKRRIREAMGDIPIAALAAEKGDL